MDDRFRPNGYNVLGRDEHRPTGRGLSTSNEPPPLTDSIPQNSHLAIPYDPTAYPHLAALHLAEREARINAAEGAEFTHGMHSERRDPFSHRPLPRLPQWRRSSSNHWVQPIPDNTLGRPDKIVRTSSLDLISSIMMNPNVDAENAVATLTDVSEQCRDAGVPFSELLEVEIDGYEMNPLMIEIIRCDFEGAPDLLLFLIQHMHHLQKFQWYIKRACLLRDRHDDLFEKLRQFIPSQESSYCDPPPFEYVISSEQYTTPRTAPSSTPPNTLRALISIPRFSSALQANAVALDASTQTWENRGQDWTTSKHKWASGEAGLVCEIIALKRSWTLEVGRNLLILTLIDGLPCNVDATVTVIGDDRRPGVPEALPVSDHDPADPMQLLMEALETGGGGDEIDGMASPPTAMDDCDDFEYCDDFEEEAEESEMHDTGESKGKGAGPSPTIDDEPAVPVNAAANLRRPTVPILELAKWAIIRSPGCQATVVQICDAIKGQYPFYAKPDEFERLKSDLWHKLGADSSFELLADGPRGNSSGGGYWAYTDVSEETSWGEDQPLPTGPTPFVFPQATLYPRHTAQGQYSVTLPRCFGPKSNPSSFIGAALASGQLLVQLVLRLYDELDLINDPPETPRETTTTIGATGFTSTRDPGEATGHRSQGTGSADGWSVVDSHDSDPFDSDGEISYVTVESEHPDSMDDSDDGSSISGFTHI